MSQPNLFPAKVFSDANWRASRIVFWQDWHTQLSEIPEDLRSEDISALITAAASMMQRYQKGS